MFFVEDVMYIIYINILYIYIYVSVYVYMLLKEVVVDSLCDMCRSFEHSNSTCTLICPVVFRIQLKQLYGALSKLTM